jgi:hypothetical protein
VLHGEEEASVREAHVKQETQAADERLHAHGPTGR